MLDELRALIPAENVRWLRSSGARRLSNASVLAALDLVSGAGTGTVETRSPDGIRSEHELGFTAFIAVTAPAQVEPRHWYGFEIRDVYGYFGLSWSSGPLASS